MNILFVSSGNNFWGINPLVLAQGESLSKEGVDVHFFLNKGKGVKGYFKNIKPLKNEIENNNYDIIHAHYALSGWVALFTFMRKPLVVSFMGSDTYGSVNLHGRKLLVGYFNILSAKLLQLFVKKIIVKSKDMERYIYLKKKCEIIPNGVDFEKFFFNPEFNNYVELGLDRNKKCVLFLGDKNNERKNYLLAKQAVQCLNSKEIELINPFPLQHDKIPQYLNAANVLLLTSYIEGSPNVIKEAMACNCPIVSTDVGDVKEVIGNTEGCYITDFDPKNVAKKIEKALAFGKPTNGRVNIRHLESGFVADKIISIYNQILKKNR